jgi:hypothetical protein
MGEPLSQLTHVILQQGVSREPIWDPTKNLVFWYHEGMFPSSAAPKIGLSQIQECLKELQHS